MLAWPDDPSARGAAVPLRFAGALHALVLSGRAPELAAVYPPAAPDDDAALWRALLDALAAHDGFVHDWLDSPPQTNEVQRASALFAGLAQVAAQVRKPLVLSEIGSSAGLNLNLDRYAYRLGGRTLGRADSPVRLEPEWQGTGAAGRAGDGGRAGGLRPQPAGRHGPGACAAPRRLRLARPGRAPGPPARGAGDRGRTPRRRWRGADAVDWIAARLATARPGHCHVILHSIALQYLPPVARAAVTAEIQRALHAAPPEAPVAWLRMEGDDRRPGAALSLATSAVPGPVELARVDFHGRWLVWSG